MKKIIGVVGVIYFFFAALPLYIFAPFYIGSFYRSVVGKHQVYMRYNPEVFFFDWNEPYIRWIWLGSFCLWLGSIVSIGLLTAETSPTRNFMKGLI